MLKIVREIGYYWLKMVDKFHREALVDAARKLDYCTKKHDADGMEHYNKLCKKLISKRQKSFEKRLELRGYV